MLFSGFVERSFDVLTFASQRLEGSVALQQKRGRSDTLLYRYSYRRVEAERDTLKISVQDIPLFARPVRVGMLGASFVRDRRNDPTESRRGSFLTMDAGLSSSLVGSGANFVRFLGQFSTYHALGPNLVPARNTRFGVADPFGRPRQVLNELGEPDIPLPERFFSGGGNSHRGFGINQAGPRDLETGFPIGGRALLLNSLELRFPLLGQTIGGVLFHDMGNVFARLDDISFRVKQRDLTDFSYMVHAVGTGLRYKTPIGRCAWTWPEHQPSGLCGINRHGSLEQFPVLFLDRADFLMKRRALPIALLLLMLLPSGALPVIVDRIVATLGERIVTLSDVWEDYRIESLLEQLPAEPLDDAHIRIIAERLVDRALLEQEMQTSRFPEVPAADVERRMAEIRRGFAGNGTFQRACKNMS